MRPGGMREAIESGHPTVGRVETEQLTLHGKNIRSMIDLDPLHGACAFRRAAWQRLRKRPPGPANGSKTTPQGLQDDIHMTR